MDNASALRRQLLAELRQLRPSHVVTQRQVADALDWSPSKVTRIENGSVSISVTDLRALLGYYGVTDAPVVDGLVDLARRSRRARSPFAAFGDVFAPDALRFFDYEHSATWIGAIELLVVPGLLQTADYARAVMGVHDVGAEKAVGAGVVLEGGDHPVLGLDRCEPGQARALHELERCVVR